MTKSGAAAAQAGGAAVTEPDLSLYDADNHYYEARDAFTRHLDPKMRERTVTEVIVDGRIRHLVGGRLNHAVGNPTFDPVAKPGALYGYFRGNPEGRTLRDYLSDAEPIRAEYHDRDARLAVMDAQGVAAAWLFPTLGVMYEDALKHDPEAVCAAFRAFNRWLDDDWGFDRDGRILAAPYLSLADVDAAVAELEWALDRGAKLVCLRPAAPTTSDGPRSPGDPHFDPFWARVNEAGVTVAVHGGDSGYTTNGYASDGLQVFARRLSPTKLFLDHLNIERPIMDFLGAVVCDRVLERFPNLRLCSIENGSAYLVDLQTRLGRLADQIPEWFTEHPMDTFRRHVWINPFWEDSIDGIIGIIGADRVLFGSDWPHVEGLRAPADYLAEVAHLDDADRRRILHDNAAHLADPRPV